MPSSKKDEVLKCPCGTGLAYEACCAPYVLNELPAPTAEKLMRSRYCAFALGEEGYLLASWHAKTRPSRVRIDPEQKWIGLSIKSTEAGGAADSKGIVEFVARFKVAGKGHRLHERSRFEKIEGRWYYLEGDHL
ncbi:MAG: YchJ family protein [Halioglobus sp.]